MQSIHDQFERRSSTFQERVDGPQGERFRTGFMEHELWVCIGFASVTGLMCQARISTRALVVALPLLGGVGVVIGRIIGIA